MTRCLLLLLATGSLARADALHATSDEPQPGRHLVYAELLGKGGVYGVGYEYTLMPWLAVGAAGSYLVVEDQQLLTLAPYLHAPVLEYMAAQAFAGAVAPTENTMRLPVFSMRLDNLYARDHTIVAAGVDHVDGSDHWPVWFDLAWGPCAAR